MAKDNSERRADPNLEGSSKLTPPRTRVYAKSKGLSDDTLTKIPSVTDKVLPSDIDAYLMGPASPSTAQPYREHKISGPHRTLVYRLRRSSSLVIPGTVNFELPWSWLIARCVAKSDEVRATPFQVLCHAVGVTASNHPRLRSVIVGDDTIREHDRV